jgi:MFS family permease
LTLGVGCTFTAIAILIFGEGWVMSIAIGLQSAAASLFSVCLSLYIMDYIGKRELIFTESRRLFYTGIAWMVGPALGAWLWEEVNHWVPFLLSACAAGTMLAYFWYLRLGHNQVIQQAKNPPSNILRIIPRFFAQSSLRIAYWITLSRSIFWMTVFIYAPIYVVESGLSNWVAGLFLSLVSSLLIASPLVRRLAGRYGTRRLIVYALWLTGISMAMLFFIGAAKPIGLLFWVVAALGGAIVDVLGNIPFMRMVKPRERTEMTMIFSTWREGSQLLTPLLVSMVLLVAPFEAYYLLLAAILISAAIVATFLPRRL